MTLGWRVARSPGRSVSHCGGVIAWASEGENREIEVLAPGAGRKSKSSAVSKQDSMSDKFGRKQQKREDGQSEL